VGLAKWDNLQAEGRIGGKMLESETGVDVRYRTEGWVPLKNGWPDRAYVRLEEGKLEVKLVEIKSPNDTLSTDQELMHEVLRSLPLE
jgi:VRR-NUC domain-containing protein